MTIVEPLLLQCHASILELPVAKPNYSFEKRQRDLAKQKKKEEKRQKKLAKREDGTDDAEAPESEADAESDST